MHFCQDLSRSFGPHEGFGVGIAVGDVRVNGGNQLGDAAEDPAAQLFGRQVTKDAFHQVEPRTARRDEVHVHMGMAR